MSSIRSPRGSLIAGLLLSLATVSAPALADASYQTLPFSQNWTNTGLITVNDDWAGVPGVVGFRGDDITGATGADPQTLVGEGTVVVDVNANQTNPATFNTGGPTEFEIADPVVALAGSGTADAPYLQFHLNTTGQSNVTVAYNLRDIDGSVDNAIQQVALQFRVGTTGNFTNVPAGYIADASSGPSLATLVTPVCVVLPAAVANQAQVQVRVMTTNAIGNDEFIGVDDLVVNTAGCGAPPLTLNIGDAMVTEGDAGTVTATFTVSLTAPAGPGGVTFNIATADGTAQDDNPATEDNDYVAQSLTGQTIPQGMSTYTFNVTVNGDTNVEPNETFFVNVSNVVGATAGDVQGLGTINNDDATVIAIHDIQGAGAASPLVGMTVTTRGIVTGRKSNGYFIQEPDATIDANPLTSEGVFVFTSSTPPASATIGNLVQVAGTVIEFAPTQDPLQPPLTEISTPTTTLISTGNPLPAPIPLTVSFPSPTGAFDQLERIEGMRASAASLTANSGTLGTVNEANATSSSNGIFSAVVTGIPRSLREPGIQAPDTPPQGTIPPIPRWDSNPEVIQVDSDAQGNVQININAEAVVLNVVGPVDYGFRRYTILQDGPAVAPAPTFSGGQVPTPVSVPASSELTIATYNLERFFDTVDDAGVSDIALTPAAFEMRLNKASLGIRNFLRTPDILGVVEMENLSTLQTLATRINNDAVAAAQPNPLYEAFLVEGNDVGGIDVGYLVKRQIVSGTTPRVTVNEVVQENDAEVFVNADNTTELLNDRPTLRLDAVVNSAGGGTFPVTVMVNHLRSLNNSDDRNPGSSGWATVGERVRAKRQKQAESLARLVQARQVANPAERIVLVGDFNAFEFNDGLGDSIGVIDGTPSPDNETAVPGDGIDLVNPDLTVLLDAALERYSFVFGGIAQTLDHVLVNQAMLAATTAERVEHARINADFGALERNSSTTASRLADHDPIVAFFGVAGFLSADLSLTKTDTPDPVIPGNTITYTITATNAGPDAAVNASMTDVFGVGFTVESATGPVGWTCNTIVITGQSTVSCTNPSFAPGSAVFTIVVRTPVTATGMISNTATIASTTSDPNAMNNSATATTAVTATADLSITKTDSPDPVLAGGNITYTLTAANAGPSAATSAAVSDPLPSGTTFVSVMAPAGWTCTTPAVGASGTVSCTNPSFASAGNAVFTLVAQVAAGTAQGTVISNTAAIASTTSDPSMANNTSTATSTVNAPAVITGTKTATGPFTPGAVFSYTIVLRNNSGGNQADNPGDEFTDVLPATLELVSATSTSGTTVANVGTRTVTFNGAIPAGGSVTITIMARIPATVAEATTISNQGTFAFDADANGTNESSGVTDNPGTPGAGDATTFVVGGVVGSGVPVPALSPALLAFLALLLGTIGLRAAIRRN